MSNNCYNMKKYYVMLFSLTIVNGNIVQHLVTFVCEYENYEFQFNGPLITIDSGMRELSKKLRHGNTKVPNV